MLTPPDKGGDGNRLNYLRSARSWQRYDSELFDLLKEAVDAGHRDVGRLETSGLLSGAVFFSDILSDSGQERCRYFARALQTLAAADLWFFDPDRGLEVSSVPYGRRGSAQYLFWREIEQVWRIGASLVLFQHFSRERRHELVARRSEELLRRTHANRVVSIHSTYVVFFALCQPDHQKRFDNALQLVRKRWDGRLKIDVTASSDLIT